MWIAKFSCRSLLAFLFNFILHKLFVMIINFYRSSVASNDKLAMRDDDIFSCSRCSRVSWRQRRWSWELHAHKAQNVWSQIERHIWRLSTFLPYLFSEYSMPSLSLALSHSPQMPAQCKFFCSLALAHSNHHRAQLKLVSQKNFKVRRIRSSELCVCLQMCMRRHSKKHTLSSWWWCAYLGNYR